MRLPGTERPLVARAYPAAWLLLLAPIVAGLGDLSHFFGVTPADPWLDPRSNLGVNYEVYYYAAEELVAGGDIYTVSPPGESEFYRYLYPPVTILAALPTLLVSPGTGYWLFLGLNVAVAAGFAVLTVRYVESLGRPLGWVDCGLVFGLYALGGQMVTNYYFGNVNLLLGAGVGAGLYLIEVGDRSGRRETVAGALLGAVALVKVFPALLGLYLLRVRAWWATAGALAVGGGGLLAGEVLFAIGPFGWDRGDGPLGVGMTARWLQEAVFPRGDSHLFVGGLDPGAFFYVTIQRPLSHLLWTVVPGSPGWLEPALVLGSVGIGLAMAAVALRGLRHRFDRLVAAFVVTSVAIVVLPALQYYVALAYLPMVALAYLLSPTVARVPIALAGLLLGYAATPAAALDRLAAVPGLVETLLAPIAAIASTQLLGYALLVVTVLLARRSDAIHGGLPAAATEPRSSGPPLRAWLAARGIRLPGSLDPTAGWAIGGSGTGDGGRKDS